MQECSNLKSGLNRGSDLNSIELQTEWIKGRERERKRMREGKTERIRLFWIDSVSTILELTPFGSINLVVVSSLVPHVFVDFGLNFKCFCIVHMNVEQLSFVLHFIDEHLIFVGSKIDRFNSFQANGMAIAIGKTRSTCKIIVWNWISRIIRFLMLLHLFVNCLLKIMINLNWIIVNRILC